MPPLSISRCGYRRVLTVYNIFFSRLVYYLLLQGQLEVDQYELSPDKNFVLMYKKPQRRQYDRGRSGVGAKYSIGEGASGHDEGTR